MLSLESSNLKVAGENAIIVYFDGATLDQKNRQVSKFVQQLADRDFVWLLDVIPAYHSVLIMFDISQTDYFAVKHQINLVLQSLLEQINTANSITEDSGVIEIPVCYGLSAENDLQRIADHNHISIEQVIQLHQQSCYRVYCLGFAPGFAFLGETAEKIATPRLTTPRKKVPKGAVAIADRQTAVYPNQSPGGWNIVGLCPLELFEPEKNPPSPLKVGDTVRFKQISEHQYYQLLESSK